MDTNKFIGRKFGRITVISEHDRLKYDKNWVVRYMMNCLCECGTEKVIDLSSLRAGRTLSCSCYNREVNTKKQTTHGLSKENGKKSKISCIWTAMKQRCYNPKNKNYNNYGGRGIKVCDRWKDSIENFVNDMGNRPSDEYSLERLEVNGNYCPENCIWILKENQAKNTRRTHKITYNGKTKCLNDWCKELNLKYSRIRHMIKDLKLTFEEAITVPKYQIASKFLKK